MYDSEIQALLPSRVNPRKTTASTPLSNTTRPPNESVMMKSWYPTSLTRSALHASLRRVPVKPSIYLLTDLITSPKKSRRSMTKRPKKGNTNMKKMRRMRSFTFCYYSDGCPLTFFRLHIYSISSLLLASGHQAQKEDKRQKNSRGKEIQKRRRGEVEVVRSF